MRHLILVGACYLDTIINIPHYPDEDSKLRATSVQVRRGGNCPNALEVLLQLSDGRGRVSSNDTDMTAHLVSCLPAVDAAATRTILDSFGQTSLSSSGLAVNFDHCLYRAGHQTPASCYILRSAATGSRTSVNDNGLPDMTADEFAAIVSAFSTRTDEPTWWHFEGRLPAVTLVCIQQLRRVLGAAAVVSVEVEKPGRPGLRALAAEADVVFYSKIWAQHEGYVDAEACLQGEASQTHAKLLFCAWGAQGASALSRSGLRVFASPVPALLSASQIIDSVGAGDTFLAGVLHKLVVCGSGSGSGSGQADESGRSSAPATGWQELGDASVQDVLAFAVDLATRKVQQDGFRGLAVVGSCA